MVRAGVSRKAGVCPGQLRIPGFGEESEQDPGLGIRPGKEVCRMPLRFSRSVIRPDFNRERMESDFEPEVAPTRSPRSSV